MTFAVKFAMNIFCVTEQKYATIADGLAFLLRAKVVALRLPKLLILVKGREESIILRVTEKIGRPRSYQSRDLSITSMITDRIRHHKVLLPINHNHYNFEKKKPNTSRTNISARDNVYNKKFLHLGNSLVFFQDEWLLLLLL